MSIHLSAHGHLVFFPIQGCYEFKKKSFSGHVFFSVFVLCICFLKVNNLTVEFLGHVKHVCLMLKETTWLPEWLYYFTFLLAVYGVSYEVILMLVLIIFPC